MTNLTARPINKFLPLLPGTIQLSQNTWKALCPVHEWDGGNHDPSLQITETDSGKVLFYCHVCKDRDLFAKICSRLSIPVRTLFPNNDDKFWGGDSAKSRRTQNRTDGKKTAEYLYRDLQGQVAYKVTRYEQDDGKKTFIQSRPDGRGGWINNMRGVERILYRLPELIAADKSTPVYVVEGEKKVDALAKWGLVATCNVGGAGKWDSSYSAFLRDRRVVILPDNDPRQPETGRCPGAEHADKVFKSLQRIAAEVRIVELPGLPEKGDIVDWQADGHQLPELQELVRLAFEQPAQAITDSHQEENQEPAEIVPNEDEDDPHRLARLFVEQCYRTADGGMTLLFYRSEFLKWTHNAWRSVVERELTAELSMFIKQEFDRLNILAQGTSDPDKAPPTCRKVTRSLLANVTTAIQSLTLLRGTVTTPTWLTGPDKGWLLARSEEDAEPAEILATKSQLLHLPSAAVGKSCLTAGTPRFFTTTALDFEYIPSAGCVQWQRFLDSVWSDDPESIQTLQEWFGYCLTDDTRLQKLLTLIGPPRSGKGTICRILQRLIGAANVASPTLSSLAEQFGLASLVGKRLALVADARLSGRVDAVAVVERLLSITGEDPQDVQRKHQATLAGVRLPVKFFILANELPNLRDAAGALLSRTVLLRMTQSFAGREDRGLEQRLLIELPGILNWSIQGWQRLRERGEFFQPTSARELLDELEDLSSPVGMFAKERCVVGPEYQATLADLYDSWKEWCERHGRDKPGVQQTFGRDLRAAFPGLKSVRFGRNGERERGYRGIGLLSGQPRPYTSADFSIACDAPKNDQQVVRWESHESESCNGTVRGRERTSGSLCSDRETSSSTKLPENAQRCDVARPRLVRADQPSRPPWSSSAKTSSE